MYKATRRRRGIGAARIPGTLPKGVLPLNLNMPSALETMLAVKGSDMMRAQSEANAVARASAGAAGGTECSCLVGNLTSFAAEQGMTLAQADIDAMYGTCQASPSEFKQLVAAQGVNLEACKPWYARKKTLMAGGAIAVGLVLWRIL